ncbi:hypothetical protein OE88DRAFT_1639743 [Heliocybe sulcata]|uniref:Sulfatase-modifying factor enzyme domain-containing protein n=1 Tax=Heliocybe sulcata TaxID=5364 RepID=A0A5C3MJU9_9AGAM|nr:hypothetical protein OE88DRAFT_1639743 [Heliocybe sulcata]
MCRAFRACLPIRPCYFDTHADLAHPEAVKPFGLPTPADWHHLWRAWDTVTLGMIPSAMLHTKPIDLRHVCVFYIGHIPMFLDMLLSKTLEEDLSEPRYFKDIFERGIDPNIDDPEHCHPHSIVPTRAEDWPTLATILQFRDTVRSRLLSIYQDVEGGKRAMTRRLARTIVLCLEHEGFHVETLLYMLLQRAGSGTIPPPGPVPPFEALAKQWAAAPAPCAERAVLGPAEVELGHDDQENEDLLENVHEFENHEFGWDNESPRRVVQVGKVEFEWRPVSNGEFRAFLEREATKEESKVKMPASWVEEDGQVKVRTLYGPVAFHIAEHWPVLTSYDNLFAYAQSKGGRLPTEPELRLFLDKYEVGYEGGGNVGFRNWHPVPSTMGIMDVDGGRGSNGGVWEWTSTLFDGHDGLDPTTLYSTDFFDEVHHVVLGASYATIPRLAGRRTLRNFYQHNYPYPWVAGRIVYDA